MLLLSACLSFLIILKRKLGIIAGYLKVLQELPGTRKSFILCSGVTTKHLVCNISHLLGFLLLGVGGGKVVFKYSRYCITLNS